MRLGHIGQQANLGETLRSRLLDDGAHQLLGDTAATVVRIDRERVDVNLVVIRFPGKLPALAVEGRVAILVCSLEGQDTSDHESSLARHDHVFVAEVHIGAREILFVPGERVGQGGLARNRHYCIFIC